MLRLNISAFAVLLVSGLSLLVFLSWCVSLLFAVEDRNRQDAETMKQNWGMQLAQLQNRQRQWLTTQFHLLKRVTETSVDGNNFQVFILDYYRHNPAVWAVSHLRFDENGRSLSRSTKPGCLQPDQLRREDYLAPVTTSCRIDDKALLEIAGPVSKDGRATILLVSMEYFDFLNEFSNLTGRRLQRTADSEIGVRYEEFGADGGGMRVSLPIGERDEIFGELQLDLRPASYWSLFRSQAVAVLLVLAGFALLAIALLHFNLVRPLLGLAEKLREAASSQQDLDVVGTPDVQPGLGVLYDYVGALQQMAKVDPVTGLNNRVIFEDRLQQAIREGKRSGRKYALVMIDFRELDAIARQRGQYIADGLLRQVAESLGQALRESDHVARYDRNLFALLLEVGQRDQLDSLIEKIYLSVVRRYRVYGREFELSAYFGIAIYPDNSLDADGLYQDAGNALLRAEQSDWPIQFYHDSEDITDTSGFTLIQALRRAIDRDQLKLVYQPVVDVEKFETVYLEALLRWKDPERHDTPIERTIRLAEQSHLIKPLSNWIFEAACRFVSEFEDKEISVGINLSMIDLHDSRLPQRIETYLKRYAVKPGQIVIEITEGQIMQEPEEVVEVLAHLGVMGLSLSIDDFGTGQASLTYLKELPVEKLKIDQSFVRDMVTSADDQSIVRATIELAHNLDLKVVAEGVETLAACNLLIEMNCDYVQGYYVSRPLEAEQVADWLETSFESDLVQKDR